MSASANSSPGAFSTTERTRAQALLFDHSAATMLQAVGEATDALICVKDRAGRVLYCNSAAAAALGRSADELLGHTDEEFWGRGAESAAAMAHDRMVMETGRRCVVEERMPSCDRIYLSTKAPWRDAGGEILGVATVSIDVTEQRRVERALLDMEQHAALAVKAARIGVYEWEPGPDRATWSDVMREMFGIGPDEEISLGRAFSRVHPDDVPRVKQALSRAIDPAGDGQYHVEYRTVPNGEVRWIDSLGSVRFEERDGERTAVRLAGVAIDITARKAMESALREASRRKDEFLATLGHELRNPLAPMRAASELLGRGTLTLQQVALVQKMLDRQVAHMAHLVDDLLDTARIDKGKITLTRTRVELKPLVAATIEAARAYTEPGSHSVRLDAPAEALWVDGDPVRLAQIVSNLLHNAAKFSPEGTPIEVALARADRLAVITVSDHGQGMDSGLLPHVFELFKQGDTSSRTKGGLGIGLSLVLNLAQMHGGSVAAKSDGPGRGSQFEVRLPLVQAPAAMPAPHMHRGVGAAKRVLVVDDNRDAAETLGMLLALEGHVVEQAHDGKTALDLARRWAPDAMIVDIGLPDIDGYEVAHLARARCPAPLLLIALTGFSSAEDRQRSLDAGFDHHLVKPVSIEDLLALLGRAPAPTATSTARAP